MKPQVLQHFQQHDPILYGLAVRVGPITMATAQDLFVDLCETIVSQQLATKVASTICTRFRNLFHGENITPECVLSLSDEALRGVGLSGSKVKYMKDLAQKTKDHVVDFTIIHKKSDKEVVDTLTIVKGIGPWSAEMFLMFSLGREDVFSFGDYGLRRAVQLAYKLKKEPSVKKLTQLSKKWSPYRTHASKVLWKSLESKSES